MFNLNSNKMKTKALFFVSLIALSLCSKQAQALCVNPLSSPINKWEITDPPAGYEVINLKGTLMYGIDPNAIVAGASDNDIYIGFNQDFGNVNISIYNGMGVLVYSTVVNSGMQPVVIIPFSGVASGTYIVELNNANGYAEGDFGHE
jgi:hypothetical protein